MRMLAAKDNRQPVLQALLIAGAGALLLAGCFSSRFSFYDDPMHVSENPTIIQHQPVSLLRPEEGRTYFPLTLYSYKLDYFVFHDLFHLSNWAPGVRAMTALYHVLAALIVWRLMLALGLSAPQSFFAGLAFAVHPLGCETVCWASERKNALAGLFGFAALWVYCRWEGRWWRLPLAAVCYALANMGKPSALGILPVLGCLEFFGGAHRLRASVPPPESAASNPLWLRGARLIPFAAISLCVIQLNLAGHSATLVAPPGGTLATAAMTDLEILCRYLWNLLAPAGLSAVYLVEPVVSPADMRLSIYAGILIVLAVFTIAVSEHRARTCFAWVWLAGALGPNLNFVAIPHYMQDRYLYLSTPAFFLLLCETGEGLASRLQIRSGANLLRLAGGAYLAALAVLACTRSFVFESAAAIFSDAVHKQPLAAYARYGLGMQYRGAIEQLGQLGQTSADPARIEKLRVNWMRHWRHAVDNCPDAARFTVYSVMANTAGEDRFLRGDQAEAERYWTLAAFPAPGMIVQQDGQALALGNLSMLRLSRRQPEEAYRLAGSALALCDGSALRLARARAALALAGTRGNGQPSDAAALIDEARRDLERIPPNDELHAAAQALLRTVPSASPK